MIGQGGFGTVKFTLSLIVPESEKIKSGDLICIKKTKHDQYIKKD